MKAAAPGALRLSAHAEDGAGNVESHAHERTLD